MPIGETYVAFVIYKGSEAEFLSFPRNQIALENESVEFQCSTDSVNKSLRWYVIYAVSKETIAIIARGNSSSASVGKLKYSIDSTIRGQCNLIIEAVNMSYTGKYMCSEGFAGPEAEAELAVVGKIVSFYILYQYIVTGTKNFEMNCFVMRIIL